jgi:predicted metal-dependent phosphoesterase TrpH
MKAQELAPTQIRVDLHVHTWHSRLSSLPALHARDCYSRPRDVYRRALSRGMNLVTFTDHDTIEGCLELLQEEGDLADFFISEEVSARDPRTGSSFHVSVFGIDERQHREIQRRRENVLEMADYLNREGIPAALNHVGSSLLRGRGSLDRLMEVVASFPLIETRNGAQFAASNALAERLAHRLEAAGIPIGRTGGSDAHTTGRVGRTWTTAQATDRPSFLAALGRGRIRPEGVSASLVPILVDVYRIVGNYYGDLIANRQGYFNRQERRTAAACALLSFPLHLVALPATGTLYRQLRVQHAVRDLAHALERAEVPVPRAMPSGAEEGLSA